MILIFFSVSVLLSCLPVLHSTTNRNSSMHTCPESFRCSVLGPFKYPLYNSTDTQCGLIEVNCNTNVGKIRLGRRSYEIVSKIDFKHYPDTLVTRDRTFENLVKKNSCDALMYNLTPASPSPLLYSISVYSYPNITLFKCTKNINSAQQTDASFDPRNYKSYNACEGYTFYYNYLTGTVPSDLPDACQVVQLPAQPSSTPGLNESNIFSLLSNYTLIFFNLSTPCDDCYKRGRRCDTENGHVRCSDAIKAEESATGQTRIVDHGNLHMIGD